MKKHYIIFLLVMVIVLGLATQSTFATDTDLPIAPFKGPANATVEISVFGCFQ